MEKDTLDGVTYQAQRWYTNTTKAGQPCWHNIHRATASFSEAQAAVVAFVQAERVGNAESAYRVAIIDD